MSDLACAQCGEPVMVTADYVGVPRYAHVGEPADGHKAELQPVAVTYRRDGIWTDVSSPDLGGHLATVTDDESARRCAAAALRRLSPARNVRETWL